MIDEPIWFTEAKEHNRVWFIHQRTWKGKQQVYKTPLSYCWNAGPFTEDEWGLIQGMLIAYTDKHIVVLGEDGYMRSMPLEIFNEEYEVMT